jgi:hypothetical protein
MSSTGYRSAGITANNECRMMNIEPQKEKRNIPALRNSAFIIQHSAVQKLVDNKKAEAGKDHSRFRFLYHQRNN